MVLTRKSKIAFLDSPYILTEPFYNSMPPLSILYLASYAEKAGFEPRLFPLNNSVGYHNIFYFGFVIRNLINGLSSFKPEIIGITCQYSSRWHFTRRLTKILKSVFPDIPIVIGGTHPTAFPEYCLTSSDADYVILGEGEETSVELFKHIICASKPYGVDGIAFKDGDKVYLNRKQKFILNLDQLPFPAYHLLEIEKYKKICKKDRILQLKGLYFSLLTSRGCPKQCTFCNLYLAHGKRWRPRSPDNVLSELAYLVDRYKILQYAIVDDNFSFSRERTLAILKGIIDRKMGIKFITPNGLSVATLDEEVIWHFKESGAAWITIAIESGSEYIRNSIYNKELSTEQIYKVVASCKKHKLICNAFFMIGAPQESDKTINESLELIRKIKIPVHISITTPYFGTKLCEYYLAENILNEDDMKMGLSAIDARVPVEKLENYKQIVSWKRKMKVLNVIYCLPDILKIPGIFDLNNIRRLILEIFLQKKITSDDIVNVLNRYMPLEEHHDI